jgi:hypothetical protein
MLCLIKVTSPIDTRGSLPIACTVNKQTQGALDRRPILSLILFTRVAPHIKSKGLLIDVLFYLLYFLHVKRHVQKASDSRSTSHFVSYTFYTRSTAYIKQGTPDRRPIPSLILFTHAALNTEKGTPDQHPTLSLIFCTRAAPRTKRKGLPIRTSLSLFFAATITKWSRSCIPVLRWSCELQSTR